MSYAMLLDEARRIPDASIRVARDVSYVLATPPHHLLDLRARVRTEHRGELLALHWQIKKRFGTPVQNDYVNVFYAASEMALMEAIGRNELSQDDCTTLRRLWNALLNAAEARTSLDATDGEGEAPAEAAPMPQPVNAASV
jgi:hypothetical protein